jgi:protein TonB
MIQPMPDNQDQFFRTILLGTLGMYALLGIVVGVIKVKPPAPPDVTHLPPRIAKLIIPPKPAAPPKPEVKPEEAKPKEEEKPKEEAKPEEKKPEKKEVALKPPPSPEELAEQQRRRDMEVAKKSGLLALLNESTMKPLSDEKLDKTLSGMKVLKSSRKAEKRPGVALSETKSSGGIENIVSQLESKLKESKVIISEKNLGTSGGIAAPETAPKEDLALKERKTTAVKSPFKIKGYGDGDSPRSYEDISLVVEKYKGGVSFLYNKALRRDPSLRGTITVEFTIAADGTVSECKVSSSSMDDPAFEEDLVKRILQWKFPPILEGDVTVSYPLVFFVTG